MGEQQWHPLAHDEDREELRPDDRADRAAVSVGGLVEIVPLFFQKSTTEPVKGVKPYTRCSWPGATSTSARAATTATRR
jgi:hypothetical protein